MVGLIVPEVKYNSEVTIEKPLSEVWYSYNNLEEVQHWIPEIKNWTKIKETPNRVGSQIEFVVQNNDQPMIMTETITLYEPESKVGLRFETKTMKKEDMILFRPFGQSTTITGEHVCKGSNYLNRCIYAFFKNTFKKVDQNNLNQFKVYMESGDDKSR